jgi:hypothetical protein
MMSEIQARRSLNKTKRRIWRATREVLGEDYMLRLRASAEHNIEAGYASVFAYSIALQIALSALAYCARNTKEGARFAELAEEFALRRERYDEVIREKHFRMIRGLFSEHALVLRRELGG